MRRRGKRETEEDGGKQEEKLGWPLCRWKERLKEQTTKTCRQSGKEGTM
jgi:hypothetical protein